MHLLTYYLLIILTLSTLSGCTKTPLTHNSAKDFVNANRIITKTITVPATSPTIKATFGYSNAPAVIKAYQQFIKKGVAHSIASDTLQTIAYDIYAHPIIACSPLHLCVVQLENNEQINDIELGDAAHWVWARTLVGNADNGSYQVSVKPKQYDIATDLLITTNKRTYNIGLISKAGIPSHILTFYYPQETQQQWHATQQQQQVKDHQVIDTLSYRTALNQWHFNYRISGDKPLWKPVRAFDNGDKTFIQMPAMAAHVDLPVLYIHRRHQTQLINYRYRQPYYIIDGLFQTAYLISGKGHHQIRVVIHNRHFQ